MKEKLHVQISHGAGRKLSLEIPVKLIKCGVISLAAILVFSFAGSIYYFSRSLQLEHRVSSLRSDIQTAAISNRGLRERVDELEYAVREPLTEAVNELNQRSQMMDSILDSVGVDLADIKLGEVDARPSGGAFTALENRELPEAIHNADQYLKTVSALPLGFPLDGGISSRYGSRRDPMNKRLAFHSGIDIEGKGGEAVAATAGGVVVKAEYDRLNGKFVEIDHQNGFVTIYAHNRKLMVKKGESVARGQVIAEVGNTGRSTGTHLHYEIHYKGKPIDPLKYMRVVSFLQKKTAG